MGYKLSPITIGRDDLELLYLEASELVDLSREHSLTPTKTFTTAAVSPGLTEVLSMKSSQTLPALFELEKALSWLEQLKTSAPEIRLTLPGLPTAQLRNDIVVWFRNEIHAFALLAFEYNRALAGGFALRTGSKLHDFSFRKALLNDSEAMVKVMKRYTVGTAKDV